MPINKLVLILAAVIAAAGVTIWSGMLITTSLELPIGLFALIPALLIGCILYRVSTRRTDPVKKNNFDQTDH